MRTVRNRKGRKHLGSHTLRGLRLSLPAAGGLVLASVPGAHAFQLYNGAASGNNLIVNLDITTSYSGLLRAHSPSALLTSGVTNANGNDGDANFRSGIVGNTFSILPVLDIKNNNFGIHISGEYFVNTVYLGTNQNNQAATVNPVLAKNTNFASETRQANGHTGQLLDAFVYDSWDFGNQEFSIKAGQQTLFWGQSLFYGTNGISGGQAPIDAISAQNLVNPQTQQIFLPVGQIVATYKPNDTYTIQGYYQYEWLPYNFTGVGSYFDTQDVIGPGSSRIIGVAGTTMTNGYYLYQTKALTPPSQNGQFGISVQAQYGNYDLGLFALRYDSKTPTVYETIGPFNLNNPTGASIGTYKEVYPRDIGLYGTSLSTTIGAANVAGELSGRTNMPLVGSAAPTIYGVGNQGNASNDPLYPVGDTMTGLASFIYGSPGLSWDPGGVTALGEVEYVQVLKTTANSAALAPGRSAAASAFDVEVEPTYFGVLPNLELQFPISISYNFAGNSQMDTTMNHGTGSYSIGVTATYRSTWDASLSYVGYYGKVGTNETAPNVQGNADRAYIGLNLQHTF
jgi:hypothetical protein